MAGKLAVDQLVAGSIPAVQTAGLVARRYLPHISSLYLSPGLVFLYSFSLDRKTSITRRTSKMSVNSKYASYSTGNGTSSSSGSRNTGDDERDNEIKLEPMASIRGTLQYVYGTANQYGQSIGVLFGDGKLVDGVLMRRTDKPHKHKLFNWSQVPVVKDDDEPLSAEHAPQAHSESFAGSTYTYELVAARVEGDDEAGVPADPAEPVDVGDFMVWESGGQKPSATAKVLAQLLTPLGRDAIVDPEDINNWLKVEDENGDYAITLRDDLKDREVEVFKVEVEGDKYTFHRPVILDTKTGEEITIGSYSSAAASTTGSTDNESEAASSLEPESESGNDGNVSEAASDGNGFPEPVQDFVEFCVDFELTDDTQILDNLYQMCEQDSNDLTEDHVSEVGGEEIVLQTIHEEVGDA